MQQLQQLLLLLLLLIGRQDSTASRSTAARCSPTQRHDDGSKS